MTYGRSLGFAVLVVLASGCARTEETSIFSKKIAPLGFDDAKIVFQDQVNRRYGNHFRILNWEPSSELLDIAQPSNYKSFAVSYALECSSPADITLMGNQDIIRSEDVSHRVTFLRGGFERTASGYRIVNTPVRQILCVAGQKIDFTGEVTFMWAGNGWMFVNQAPQLSNPAKG